MEAKNRRRLPPRMAMKTAVVCLGSCFIIWGHGRSQQVVAFMTPPSTATLFKTAFLPKCDNDPVSGTSGLCMTKTNNSVFKRQEKDWMKMDDDDDDENDTITIRKAAVSVVDEKSTTKKSTQPTPVLMKAFKSIAGDHPEGIVAAAALAFVLMFAPLSASAAMSGGRMGGSFSSSPAPSTRSMPSTRSYSRGYSSGYRSGYYSRPSVTIAPTIAPFNPFYSPFAFPRPFFFGGPGVITYSRGPSFFDLLVLGGISFMIFNAIRTVSSGASITNTVSSNSLWNDVPVSALGSGTSVAQVTVALEVPNRDDPYSILSVLDRLAETSRTDSRVGIQNLSSQVALELLRRKSSIVSASTRYKHFKDRNLAQRDFNSLSVKERGKFEQETVSKYGGVDYGSDISRKRRDDVGGNQATVAVVSIILAIDGDSTKLPSIASMKDVEEALRKIAADVKVDSCLQSAEILWTPEDRSETLTMRDVVADYPSLRSV